MWAARVPWTAAARYAAGACAASLAAPPPTDCDAVRRRAAPRFTRPYVQLDCAVGEAIASVDRAAVGDDGLELEEL